MTRGPAARPHLRSDGCLEERYFDRPAHAVDDGAQASRLGPPVEELDAELAAWNAEDRGAVAGKACLFDNGLVRVPPDIFVGNGSAPEDLTGRVYDPGGTFGGSEHVLPFGGALKDVVEPFAAEGAVA